MKFVFLGLVPLLINMNQTFAGEVIRVDPPVETEQTEEPKRTPIGEKPVYRDYYKMLEEKEKAENKGEDFTNEQEEFSYKSLIEVTLTAGPGYIDGIPNERNIIGTFGIEVFGVAHTDNNRLLYIDSEANLTPFLKGGEISIDGYLRVMRIKPFNPNEVENSWGFAPVILETRGRLHQDQKTAISPIKYGIGFKTKGMSNFGILVGPEVSGLKFHPPEKDPEKLDELPSQQLAAFPVDLSLRAPKEYTDPRTQDTIGFVTHAYIDLRPNKFLKIQLDAHAGETFYKFDSEILERINFNGEAKIIVMTRGPIGFFAKGQYNQYWLKNSEKYNESVKSGMGLDAENGSTQNGAIFLGMEFGARFGENHVREY